MKKERKEEVVMYNNPIMGGVNFHLVGEQRNNSKHNVTCQKNRQKRKKK